MKLDEYERSGRELYQDFADAVGSIVAHAIKETGGFRLQHVESRAKEVGSLKQKLSVRKLSIDTDVTQLKDLAGSRAIFYTNSDVERFLNSGLVEANFEIIERKLHYPHRDTDGAADLYMANHYVVQMTKERAALPEYRRFAGLKCELQIQTILNHSWAATAHDTIYKAPKLESFGTAALKGIEERLARISKKYLVPAGYEFDRVFHDFERILAGKSLLDGDALTAIVKAGDNNERLSALETFAENVLPLYDDIPAIFPEVVRAFVDAATVAKKTAPAPRNTPFGSLPPIGFPEVLNKITSVMQRYRYVDIELTFATLRQLWEFTNTEEERKPLLSLASALAKHDLSVWKRYGPAAQDLLVNAIGSMRPEARVAISPLIGHVLAAVLESELRGTTSTSSTVTIHTGTVRASQKLREVRSAALDILENLVGSDLPPADRLEVRRALLAAATPPFQGAPSAELTLFILSDAKRVIEILARQVGTLPLDERQAIEANIHDIFRRNAALPAEFAEDESLVVAQAQVREAALAFRDAANADPEFEMYKVLVGFRSVYPAAWTRDGLDWRADRAYREQRAKALLDEVRSDNSDEWFERLSRFAATDSRDLATFPVLGEFLNSLSERCPTVVLDWVSRGGVLIDKFLPGILLGLMRSDERDSARELVSGWVLNGEHLNDIAWYLRSAEPLDEALLARTIDRAIAQSDMLAIGTCIDACVRQFEHQRSDLIISSFLQAVRAMDEANDRGWVERRMTPWMDAPLLLALDEKQAGVVLDALVSHPRLEHDPEYISAAIAEAWPDRTLRFFSDRQEYKRSRDADRYYDAVPFHSEAFRRPFSRVPALVLGAALEWYQKWPESFRYDGGQLLASTFPNLPPDLADNLETFLDDCPEFVLGVLEPFEGIPEIYPLVQKVVSRAEPGSDVLDEARSVLDESGVVSGEFGFAELCAERRKLLEPWLDDENQRVREFAKQHIDYLNRRELAETKRAEASIAARKLEYGEDIIDEAAKVGPDAIPDRNR